MRPPHPGPEAGAGVPGLGHPHHEPVGPWRVWLRGCPTFKGSWMVEGGRGCWGIASPIHPGDHLAWRDGGVDPLPHQSWDCRGKVEEFGELHLLHLGTGGYSGAPLSCLPGVSGREGEGCHCLSPPLPPSCQAGVNGVEAPFHILGRR